MDPEDTTTQNANRRSLKTIICIIFVTNLEFYFKMFIFVNNCINTSNFKVL